MGMTVGTSCSILTPTRRKPFVAYICAPDTDLYRAALRDGLHDLGWRNGDNLRLEWRFADFTEESVKNAATDLIRDGVDVFVTSSVPFTKWVMQVTQTIPIVMGVASSPVEQGVIASYAHPGGNVTGEANPGLQLVSKRVQVFRELMPQLKRLGILWSPTSSTDSAKVPIAQAAAAELGVDMVSVPVSDPEALAGALLGVGSGRVDAIHVFAGEAMKYYAHGAEIHAFAQQQDIADLYEEGGPVDAGGLLAVFIDLPASMRRSTRYIDKILRGAAPADLPVELPTTFEFELNTRTASVLGLTIPPSIVAQVTRWVS